MRRDGFILTLLEVLGGLAISAALCASLIESLITSDG